RVANRSKVSALAEYWHTESRRAGDLIYVSVGTGVAAGVIHHGELFMGTNSSAGELGHITVLPEGPPCACGNRGCLQQLVSESALAQRARIALRSAEEGPLLEAAGRLPEQLAAEDVLAAGEAGDETAAVLIRETAEYLAIGVATLVNLFNPRIVCLGGPMIEQSRLLYEETVGGVQRRAMSYPLSVLDIRRSTLGMEAGAVGASVLILKSADELLFS
ncbi:MAG: ROK family protein, partial [Spirochaetaceae bacterium]